MGINIIFTKSFGQVIGETTENLDGSVTVETPCVIQFGHENIALIPLLGATTEKSITLKSDEIMGGKTFEPTTNIRNYYSTNFGSTGIQLVTDSPLR